MKVSERAKFLRAVAKYLKPHNIHTNRIGDQPIVKAVFAHCTLAGSEWGARLEFHATGTLKACWTRLPMECGGTVRIIHREPDRVARRVAEIVLDGLRLA